MASKYKEQSQWNRHENRIEEDYFILIIYAPFVFASFSCYLLVVVNGVCACMVLGGRMILVVYLRPRGLSGNYT